MFWPNVGLEWCLVGSFKFSAFFRQQQSKAVLHGGTAGKQRLVSFCKW
jgi:hypothetical protein